MQSYLYLSYAVLSFTFPSVSSALPRTSTQPSTLHMHNTFTHHATNALSPLSTRVALTIRQRVGEIVSVEAVVTQSIDGVHVTRTDVYI